jgi:hypothetical protein
MKRSAILILLMLGLLFGGIGQAPSVEAAATRAGSCGEWRWPVKTLSDPARRRVNFHPRQTQVAKMRTWNAPNTLSSSTPRFGFVEFHTWTLKARPIQAKLEDDKDIHLVVSVPSAPKRTMIVEFPKPICVKSHFKRHKIGAARSRFLQNCGQVSASSWLNLAGSITLVGVGFWDEKHGQTGVAPNAIELHPVLNISGDCHKRTSGGGGGGGGDCTPGYSPCLVYHGGADYDCYGQGGNGPYFTKPGVVYSVDRLGPVSARRKQQREGLRIAT